MSNLWHQKGPPNSTRECAARLSLLPLIPLSPSALPLPSPLQTLHALCAACCLLPAPPRRLFAHTVRPACLPGPALQDAESAGHVRSSLDRHHRHARAAFKDLPHTSVDQPPPQPSPKPSDLIPSYPPSLSSYIHPYAEAPAPRERSSSSSYSPSYPSTPSRPPPLRSLEPASTSPFLYPSLLRRGQTASTYWLGERHRRTRTLFLIRL